MIRAPEMASVVGRDVTRAQDEKILADEKLWQVVSSGDLKGLTPKQKSDYYLYRCRQEGLNPAGQPFQFMTLQGKEILYAGKGAADQLRKLHGVSIVGVECVEDDDYLTYEVRVRDREGREDFEIGSVFVGTAKGVERSNARMKALTKAKRRATYSICGTGVLDETEVETIAGSRIVGMPEDVNVRQVDTDTGDIVEADDPVVAIADDDMEARLTKAELATGIRRMARDLEWTQVNVSRDAHELGLAFDNARYHKRLRLLLDAMKGLTEDEAPVLDGEWEDV